LVPAVTAAGPVGRLAVVIVTYNSGAVIGPCLGSLGPALAGLDAPIVVVADNASSDDTLDQARAALAGVRIVPTGGNLGYSAAINRGQAAAGPHDFLLVLNPDIVVQPGSIPALMAALGPAGRGIAVPRMLDESGRLSSSLRREPSLATALGESVLGGPRAGRLGLSEMITDPRRYDEPGPVDWATGAALLISQRCFEAVGPWDESFFLYSEETDYMLRARDHGFLTWYTPTAVVNHRGGESGTSPRLWSLLMANKVRLYARRHNAAQALAYRLILGGAEGLRALLGKPRSKAAVRAIFGAADPVRAD
jgi:GT2 family glycosyltransferase